MIETDDQLVNRSVHRIDSTTARLAIFAERLDSLATAAHSIVADLRDSQGTLPRLIHDDQLLRRWEKTVEDIDELVGDIRANPKKYLQVDVSLF
jgi:phospholipid/cholesterol/gamma-HCH transport system substrate-binding protein